MAVLTLALSGIVAIVFGVIVLVWPRSLNILVGLYLLITGVLQVLGGWDFI